MLFYLYFQLWFHLSLVPHQPKMDNNAQYSTRMFLVTPQDFQLISKLKRGDLPEQEGEETKTLPPPPPPPPPPPQPEDSTIETGTGRKETPDIDMIKFYQKMVTDKDTKRMLENKEWKELYKRLQPLFSMRPTVAEQQQQQQQQSSPPPPPPPSPPPQQQQQQQQHQQQQQQQQQQRRQPQKFRSNNITFAQPSLAWDDMQNETTELPSSYFTLSAPTLKKNLMKQEHEQLTDEKQDNPFLEELAKRKLLGYMDSSTPKKVAKVRNVKTSQKSYKPAKHRLEVSPLKYPASPFGPGQSTRTAKRNRNQQVMFNELLEEKKKKGNGKKPFKWTEFK